MLPAKRQSLFFSATLAPNIVELAQTILRDPAHVSITPETTTAEKIDQQICFLARESKRPLLEQLLRAQAGASQQKLTIVFSRTKHGANKLAKSLCAAGFPADAIHGNKSQAQREKALDRFKRGLTPVLVATDVAARGVDVRDDRTGRELRPAERAGSLRPPDRPHGARRRRRPRGFLLLGGGTRVPPRDREDHPHADPALGRS